MQALELFNNLPELRVGGVNLKLLWTLGFRSIFPPSALQIALNQPLPILSAILYRERRDPL